MHRLTQLTLLSGKPEASDPRGTACSLQRGKQARREGGKRAAHLAGDDRNSLFVSIWRSSTDGGKAFFS